MTEGNAAWSGAPRAERHRMAYEFAEFARIVTEKDAAAEAEARRRTLAVMEMLEAMRPY